MHRQASRSTVNSDAIDCLVNTNDLALENEELNQKHEQRRELSNSKRDQPSKRSNDNSNQRSTRHSPPSVTRKRHPSPPPVSSTRSHHHHYPSQRHPRAASPSPPPQPSSRHRRPVTAVKRPHSKSRSPYDRRPPTHRSRPEAAKDRTIDDVLTSLASSEESTTSKKKSSKQETADLSLISDDEPAKTRDIRSNSTTTNESSSNNKLHSTPSLPILQPNPNESLLDMSTISRDCELSIFAKSALSNNNSILPTPVPPTNECMQTIDLISKYKMMQALPYNNPQVEAYSKDILTLIQKQIELQKMELSYREREIKFRERELAEREKRFIEKSNDTTSMTSVNSEPLVGTKSTIIEEKSPMIIDQVMNTVLPEGSVIKTISPPVDTSKMNLFIKNGSNQPVVSRKTSRFSKIIIDPSIFPSQQKPVIGLYSDDHEDNQSSSSLNTNNSLKKTTISKILAPNESTVSIVDADLKVTSSNSCRKVEFQSGNTDKTIPSKGSSHDLRLTLSKNRTKQQMNDDLDNDTNGNQLINDDQTKSISSKLNSNKDDDKQQSNDYQQQQRSITSASIETVIDNSNDKRDNRRQQRTNSSRQHQYPVQNSSTTNERSYTHGSASRYGSNQKRHESDDLRSHLSEHQHHKISRTTHRNNY